MNQLSNNNSDLPLIEPPAKISFFKRIQPFYFIILSVLLLLISVYYLYKNVKSLKTTDSKENQIKIKKNIRNSRIFIIISIFLLLGSIFYPSSPK